MNFIENSNEFINMSNNEPQADILIVDDQPYSSGGSIIEEEEEKKEADEEKKVELVEQAKEEKKPKKCGEPIFVPVITGTATIESNFAYSEKSQIGENSQKERNATEDENKKRSKCCLLV